MQGPYQRYLDNITAALTLAKPPITAEMPGEEIIATIRRCAEGLYQIHQDNDGILREILFSRKGEELTAREAIETSKEMMYGNRWRLFCLHISFIGWAILCAFTLGIGSLWLNPYSNVAEAAFYRDISGTGFTPPLENSGYF